MPNKKVLFVDDSPMDRMILSKVLEEIGLDFIDTKTPEEFLGKLKTEEPDICLIDLNIRQPNDGQVLVQAIRNRIGPDLPIIVISALENSKFIQKNLDVGANDFVCKPIDKSLLSSKISNYFKSRRINSFVLPLFRVPEREDNKSSIEFMTYIEKVDESGIQFVSNHKVKENTKFLLNDPYIDQIFKEGPELEMTINKVWDGAVENVYHFNALFNQLSHKQKQRLRKFITELQIQAKLAESEPR